jgi:hypothetical protein
MAVLSKLGQILERLLLGKDERELGKALGSHLCSEFLKLGTIDHGEFLGHSYHSQKLDKK